MSRDLKLKEYNKQGRHREDCLGKVHLLLLEDHLLEVLPLVHRGDYLLVPLEVTLRLQSIRRTRLRWLYPPRMVEEMRVWKQQASRLLEAQDPHGRQGQLKLSMLHQHRNCLIPRDHVQTQLAHSILAWARRHALT